MLAALRMARRLLVTPGGDQKMHPFEKMNQAAAPWVESMMAQLSTADPYQALRALGAGLEAVRDLLTPAEAARFTDRLPPLIRGLFFERWDPAVKPREVHDRNQLLALVGEKYAPRSDPPTDVVAAAFLAVLDCRLGAEEMSLLARRLPAPVIDFGWRGLAGKIMDGRAGAAEPQPRVA
jgi:uncharacterized protein (DUF2267 family)